MKAHKVLFGLAVILIFSFAAGNLQSQTFAQKLTYGFNITSSPYDNGCYQDLFDDDPHTLLRSAGVNPAFIQFNFDKPESIDSLSVIIGMINAFPRYDADIWWLEVADNETDLANKTGSYKLLIDHSRDTNAGVWQAVRYKPAIIKKIWKFTVKRTDGDNYVHVPEIGLYKFVDLQKMEIQYPLPLEIKSNNVVVDFSAWRPPTKALDGDLNTFYDFSGDREGYVQLAFEQKQNFSKSRVLLKDTCQWWIEGADNFNDLENKVNTYFEMKNHQITKPDKWDTINFSGNLSKKILRVHFSKPEGQIRLNEVEFFSAGKPELLYGLKDSLELWEGWKWRNISNTLQHYGLNPTTKKNIKWTSSDTNVANVDEEGFITAKKSGNSLITAKYKDVEHVTKVRVIASVLKSEKNTLNQFMSTPADNCVYEMPVLIINYIPTTDGINKDSRYSPDLSSAGKRTLAEVKQRVMTYLQRFKFALEEGSRFRKYKNPNARPSIGVKVVDYITVYEPCPPSVEHCTVYTGGTTIYAIDFKQIFERLNIKDYIENKNVKEIWFWASGLDAGMWSYNPDIHRPENFRSSFESFMSTPTEFKACNGCQPEGLPVYNKTYTVICGDYSYSEFVPQNFEPFTHQFEALWLHQNWMQEGKDKYSFWDWNGTERDFFFNKFCGNIGRCGWTHTPPNTTINYGYFHFIQEDTNRVKPYWCDIEDWKPDSSGQKTLISYHTWEDKVYNWPDGVTDWEGRRELQWFIYWLQSIPGYENNIPYFHNDTLFRMSNWWKFIYDWDKYSKTEIGLWEADPYKSVKEGKDDTGIMIYPNPAGRFLYVCLPEFKVEEDIIITNLTGSTVWKGKTDKENFSVNIEFLPDGLYFVRIGNHIKSFIKN